MLLLENLEQFPVFVRHHVGDGDRPTREVILLSGVGCQNVSGSNPGNSGGFCRILLAEVSSEIRLRMVYRNSTDADGVQATANETYNWTGANIESDGSANKQVALAFVFHNTDGTGLDITMYVDNVSIATFQPAITGSGFAYLNSLTSLSIGDRISGGTNLAGSQELGASTGSKLAHLLLWQNEFATAANVLNLIRDLHVYKGDASAYL